MQGFLETRPATDRLLVEAVPLLKYLSLTFAVFLAQGVPLHAFDGAVWRINALAILDEVPDDPVFRELGDDPVT